MTIKRSDLAVFTGIPIIENNSLGWRSYQYRYPASRSKRIRRKWAKKYRRSIQDPVGYQMPDMFSGRMMVIANAAFIAEIRKQTGEFSQ